MLQMVWFQYITLVAEPELSAKWATCVAHKKNSKNIHFNPIHNFIQTILCSHLSLNDGGEKINCDVACHKKNKKYFVFNNMKYLTKSLFCL